MNKVNLKDVKFEYFKRANSKGGQKQNKTSSAVRATHIPSGIVVEASEGRSQSANKELAIEKIQTELDALAEKIRVEKEAAAYKDKPDASFSAQVRTYRMCGKQQNVVDHRTNVVHTNVTKVLNGDIDKFLMVKND